MKKTILLSLVILLSGVWGADGGSEAYAKAKLNQRSPHWVAYYALEAYKKQDLAAYSQVYLGSTKKEGIFKHAQLVGQFKKIRSIHLQDPQAKQVVALLQKKKGSKPAIYFLLTRKGSRYFVKDLVISEMSPIQ